MKLLPDLSWFKKANVYAATFAHKKRCSLHHNVSKDIKIYKNDRKQLNFWYTCGIYITWVIRVYGQRDHIVQQFFLKSMHRTILYIKRCSCCRGIFPLIDLRWYTFLSFSRICVENSLRGRFLLFLLWADCRQEYHSFRWIIWPYSLISAGKNAVCTGGLFQNSFC